MLPLLLLPLPLFFHVANALLNVTIDDTDPLITYQGTWEPSATLLSGLDYGGSHTLSTDPSASATLTFTGVAIYYVVPRWPYTVNTQLSLDGGSPVVVDLTDPSASKTSPGGSESAPYSVAWSREGLSNTTHKLVLTMASTGQFIVADGFIYTVDNGSSPSSTSQAKTGSPTPSATSGGSAAASSAVPAKSNTLAIIVGCAVGAVALIAGILIALFIYKRRYHQKPRKSNVLDEWGADAYPPPPAPFIVGSPQRATHQPSMSDASTGPLLATPWDRPVSQYRDNPRAPSGSVSEYSYGASGSASGSGSKSGSVGYGYGLPPGARVAEPGSYDDDSELASGSGSIARTASSAGMLVAVGGPVPAARREKAVPMRDDVYTPAPPAYEE
ncbi:hypothetical protein DFH06DRAFT_1324137 [Mycena polygramma]|nr:hypothetical protein DFH06DRAFT_1324137 [Mycena polygramma]